MSVKLLTEHHLVFLRLKGGCTGSSESTLVKIPHCWKSHVTAHFRLTEQAIVAYSQDIFFIHSSVFFQLTNILSIKVALC